MNDLKRIEELLEKYYQGETSTPEEVILREFFAGEDIPAHLEADAELFRYFGKKKEDTLSGEMEERLVEMISNPETKNIEFGTKSDYEKEEMPETRKIGGGTRLRYYWFSAAAAVILILIGIFIDMQIRKNTFETRQDTYEDPYLAYAEAKKALYMVSSTMNTGRKPLKNIKKLDAGVNYLSPVFSFGAGIQHLEHLNTIEEARKIISKD